MTGPRTDTDLSRFLQGVQLFNEGAAFEAHEVWEDLWREVKSPGPSEDEVFLRAMIRLAAAVVKQQRNQPTGTLAHARSVLELLPLEGTNGWGADILALRAMAQLLLDEPARVPGRLPQQLPKSG